MSNTVLCPITRVPINELTEPVVGEDGHTYERSAITEWLRLHGRSPVTNQDMDVDRLIPNRALVENYKKRPRDESLHDFVMVVDSSGSMSSTILSPTKEDNGLVALDIAIHGVKTLGHSLSEYHRLAVVDFSNKADTIFPLSFMDAEGKSKLDNTLSRIVAGGGTNIRDALHVSYGIADTENICPCTIIISTDGCPSNTPPRGWKDYITKLNNNIKVRRPYLRCIGYGVDTDSNLLCDFADASNGTYCYTPDAGFVGTVIQHILANSLHPSSPDPTLDTQRKMFSTVLRKMIDHLYVENNQSYYYSRSNVTDEQLQVARTMWDEYCANDNILKEEQVTIAISSSKMWKWGKHYLPSLMLAHERGECNNFKDPTVQQYRGGTDWNSILDKADEVFCSIPPPKPSRVQISSYRGISSYTSSPPITPIATMRSYSQQSAPCVAAISKMETPDGYINACDVREGTVIKTHKGWDVVEYVTESMYSGKLINVGKLQITPWHPVCVKNTWVFPQTIKDIKDTSYYGNVYSFVLKNRSSKIIIEDIQVISLGHGLSGDVIGHNYWGTEKVVSDLINMPNNYGVITITYYMLQYDLSGLVCGIKLNPYEAANVQVPGP